MLEAGRHSYMEFAARKNSFSESEISIVAQMGHFECVCAHNIFWRPRPAIIPSCCFHPPKITLLGDKLSAYTVLRMRARLAWLPDLAGSLGNWAETLVLKIHSRGQPSFKHGVCFTKKLLFWRINFRSQEINMGFKLAWSPNRLF
jgi:hypothetical protein